jgi:hypothetical protein
MNDMLLDLSVASLMSSNKENQNDNSMIVEIQSVITTKQRLLAFNRLRKILQKTTDSETHNASKASSTFIAENSLGNSDSWNLVNLENFIKDGGFTTLVMQLHRLVYTHGSTTAELDVLCNCLALLFGLLRRQAEITQQILTSHGPDLLILLSNAIKVAIQRKQGQNGIGMQSVHSVRYDVVFIFRIISSSSIGTNVMVKCRIALESLVLILGEDEITNDGIALEILSVYKNLTYYQEDYRITLLKSPGFINGIGLLSKKCKLSLKSRQRLSAVIRNLAISVECRSILVAYPTVIDTLIQLLGWEPQSSDDSTSVTETNRNVVNTLISLAMDHDSALILIFYGDGVLLHILQRYLKVSSDTYLRKKSACILRLLAHEVSAPLLVHDANLMYSLSDAALRDDSSDVRKEAAEAFARCAALVQIGQQPHYESVLDALTMLVTRRSRLKAGAIDSLARALREQSSHRCNQRPMADRGILLEAISEIGLSREFNSSNASRDACCALMHLSQDERNLEKLTKKTIVLDAILSNATAYPTYYDSSEDNGKMYALTTLVNLAKNTNCRRIMVRHRCLFQTLVHESKLIRSDRSDFKDMLKEATLLLASEL